MSSLKHFPFKHAGYMPTSVHKLICRLFMYIWHYWTFPTFKDENTNALENALEIRNYKEKAVAYGYLFSCIFALGLL